MRDLTDFEIDFVDGSGALLVVAGMVGTMFYFGYEVGKDMAERDSAR